MPTHKGEVSHLVGMQARFVRSDSTLDLPFLLLAPYRFQWDRAAIQGEGR